MICLNPMIEVAFWWSDYNKKKNAFKAKKGAKGKGTEGASEEKGTLQEWTLQIDLYLKSLDFSQMELTRL